MTKIMVLYYSIYGHVEVLAKAVAKGVTDVNEIGPTIKRVPELLTLL